MGKNIFFEVLLVDCKQNIHPDKHLQDFENRNSLKLEKQRETKAGKRGQIAVKWPCALFPQHCLSSMHAHCRQP